MNFLFQIITDIVTPEPIQEPEPEPEPVIVRQISFGTLFDDRRL
jgi:hypothetical protein